MSDNIPKLLIIMGPPGSGKGTQAKLLQEKYGHNYIATGDLVREMIGRAETGDPLGREIKERYDRGEPQPDNIILKSVRQKLNEIDITKGIIFDAFPLSEPQAWGLEEIIHEYKLVQPVAISIIVDQEEVVKRLSLRKFCPKCNIPYYPKSPNYESNKCTTCDSELVRRADDLPEVVRERFKEYENRIRALVNYYKKAGQLIEINGEQTVDEVAAEILRKLNQYRPPTRNTE